MKLDVVTFTFHYINNTSQQLYKDSKHMSILYMNIGMYSLGIINNGCSCYIAHQPRQPFCCEKSEWKNTFTYTYISTVHTSSERPHIYGHACVYRAITSSKCLVCHYYWLSRAPKPNHKRRRWKFLKFRSVVFSNLMHQQPRLAPKLRIRTILWGGKSTTSF